MNLPRRHFLHLAAGTVALPATLRVARAQIYPTRPVTIIDAFAPGGTTDASARIIGQHMSRTPLNLTYVAHSEYLAGRTPPVCLRARPFSRAEGAAVRVATCTPAAAPGALNEPTSSKADFDCSYFSLTWSAVETCPRLCRQWRPLPDLFQCNWKHREALSRQACMNVASKPRDAAVAERLVIGLASIAILMAGL